jgi:hypothetical protein
MDHFRNCTDVLRRVISAGEVDGIPHAERALEEMVDKTPSGDRKSSLASARQMVTEHGTACGSDSHLSLADTVNDYIEKLMRGLE